MTQLHPSRRVALTLLALVLGYSAACGGDGNIGTVEEASFAVEQPATGVIQIELPNPPDRPRRQSSAIRLRSNGPADLQITSLRWLDKPSRLFAQKDRRDISGCDECVGEDLCVLQTANPPSGICVETGLPETPFTLPHGQIYDIELYVSAAPLGGGGDLDCPTPGPEVPALYREGYCGALRIETNARNNSGELVSDGESTIYFSISSQSGEIELSESFIDFSSVAPGFSESRTFGITNSGSAPLTIDGLQMQSQNQYFTIGGPSSIVLAPQQSQQYTLQLTLPDDAPESALNFNTSLNITSSAINRADGIILVRVSADNPPAPQIRVTPQLLRFDAEPRQQLTIENIGGATLLFNGVTFEPASIARFYSVRLNDAPLPQQLSIPHTTTPEHNNRRVLDITFDRLEGDDAPAAGTIILRHGDRSVGGVTRVITLGDLGDVALGELAPQDFAFSNREAAAQERRFAIINRGSAPLELTGVTLMSLNVGEVEEFQINATFPATVAPGGIFEGSASFKSENATPDRLIATFASNSAGAPMVLGLSSSDAMDQPPSIAVATSFAQRAVVGQQASFDASMSAPVSARSGASWVLLSRPAGSMAYLNVTGERAAFTPDVAGTYRVAVLLSSGTIDAQEIITFEAE